MVSRLFRQSLDVVSRHLKGQTRIACATRARPIRRGSLGCERQSSRARPDEAPFCHENPRPPNQYRCAAPGNGRGNGDGIRGRHVRCCRSYSWQQGQRTHTTAHTEETSPEKCLCEGRRCNFACISEPTPELVAALLTGARVVSDEDMPTVFTRQQESGRPEGLR